MTWRPQQQAGFALVLFAALLAACGGDGTVRSALTSSVDQTSGQQAPSTSAEPSGSGLVPVSDGSERATVSFSQGELVPIPFPMLNAEGVTIEVDPHGETDVVVGVAFDRRGWEGYLARWTIDGWIDDPRGRQPIEPTRCVARAFSASLQLPPSYGEPEDVNPLSFEQAQVTVAGVANRVVMGVVDGVGAGGTEGFGFLPNEDGDMEALLLVGGSNTGGTADVRIRRYTPPPDIRADPDPAEIEAFFAPYMAEIDEWFERVTPDQDAPTSMICDA